MAVQKNKLRHSSISASVLTSETFSSLWPILLTANNEARALELIHYDNISDPNTYDREKTRLGLESTMVIQIAIHGADGQYIQTDDLNELANLQLPNPISRISIDNSSRYELILKVKPLNQFRITLDFSVPQIFDLSRSPTQATENGSNINILGTSEIWVDGTYSKVREIFDSASSKMAFLHRHAIYDLLLWPIYVPLLVLSLFRFDKSIALAIPGASAALLVIAYLNLLVLALYLFRFLFNYARWLFPYFELDFQRNKRRSLQKAAYILVIGGLVCSALYDGIKYIVLNW